MQGFAGHNRASYAIQLHAFVLAAHVPCDLHRYTITHYSTLLLYFAVTPYQQFSTSSARQSISRTYDDNQPFFSNFTNTVCPCTQHAVLMLDVSAKTSFFLFYYHRPKAVMYIAFTRIRMCSVMFDPPSALNLFIKTPRDVPEPSVSFLFFVVCVDLKQNGQT